MKKDELIQALKNDNIPEDVINDFLNAKNWATEKKNDFVSWACTQIGYLSAQPIQDSTTREALNAAKHQYELYLIVINEKTIKEIYDKYHFTSIIEFSEKLNIPYRTCQNWLNEVRTCPNYVVELIDFKLSIITSAND